MASNVDLSLPAQNAPPRFAGTRLLRMLALLTLCFGVLVAAFAALNRGWPTPWNDSQRAALRELWLGSLGPPPKDPSNRFADDPRAARLGARLFRDRRLSGNGRVACSSCHDPGRAFTDGLALAKGAEMGVRNTPSVLGAAHAPALFWDGRRDSLWSQAVTPIEGSTEMAGARTLVAGLIASKYRADYENVFGPLPSLVLEDLRVAATPLGTAAQRAAWDQLPVAARDAVNRVFANTGKALAAYQRALVFEPSRFDRYVSRVLSRQHYLADRLFSEDEQRGLELFIGKANCTSCHRGALLTGHEFFSLGLPFGSPGPDPGRAEAFRQQREDPFNCLGPYSDARPEACTEVRFLADDRLGFLASFKTPSLRNVSLTAPYMHAGQLKTLSDVIAHYTAAPRVPFPEHTDLQPLALDDGERRQLLAFLETLSSEVNDPHAAEVPPE